MLAAMGGQLHTLRLAKNYFQREGIVAIADAIRATTYLAHLDLSFNAGRLDRRGGCNRTLDKPSYT